MSFGWNELKEITKYATCKLYNVISDKECYNTYSTHYTHLASKKTMDYKKIVKWDLTNVKFRSSRK